MESTVSIIIVNWNTRAFLMKCLESVYSTANRLEIETIVIDNASTDGSAEMVTESFPQVLLICNESNTGFAAANNVGLRKASGRYVMLLNPDAELLPGALDQIAGFADTHHDVAVVGPKLLNSDGSLQKNGQMFPTLLREVLHITKLYRLMPGAFNRKLDWGREDFDIPAEVDSISGACMLVRKTALDSVGLLDEQFFMYYEEVDWCFRMKKAGWKVFYLPYAQVVHHAGQGSKQIGVSKMAIAYRSQYMFFRKNRGPVQAILLKTLSGLVLALMRIRLHWRQR